MINKKPIVGPDPSMLYDNKKGGFEGLLDIASGFATASSTFTPWALVGPAINIASGLFGNNKAKDVPKMGTKGVDMMPSKWDVNPQITRNAEGFAQGRQAIANNLVGPSITSGVNKLYSSKLMGDSEAFGTKNNMETQMRSQKAQAMQRVEAIDNQNEMKQWQAQMAYDDNAGALGNFARAGVGQLGDTMVTMERDKNKQRTDMLIAALTASAYVPRYNDKEAPGTTLNQQSYWSPPQQSYGPNMPTQPVIPSAVEGSPAPEGFYLQPRTGAPFAQQGSEEQQTPQINETKLAELMQQYPKPAGMNEEVYKAKLLQMNK